MKDAPEVQELPLQFTNRGSLMAMIPVNRLRPHPDNPRICLLDDVIDGIAIQLQDNGFPPSHALRVRPLGDVYQIVEGHHRWQAAIKAGLTEVPCWVEDLDGDEAFMQLLLGNTQGELSPLERGIHALGFQLSLGARGKEGGLREYGRRVHMAHSYLVEIRQAARVYRAIKETGRLTDQFRDKAMHLRAIYRAPEEAWPLLVDAMFTPELPWSVEETEAAVKRVKALCEAIPDWWEGLDRQGLIRMACAGTAAAQTAMFKEARKIHDELTPVSLEILQQTGEKETREGRVYTRWATVSTPYDPAAVFRDRVRQELSLPTAARIRELQKAILLHIHAHSQAREEWHPEQTDEEYQAEQARLLHLQRLSLRELYTPRLIHADVIEGLRQIADESIDLICTDPPYNMDKADWDTIPDYAAWVRSWLTQCYRVLKPSGSIYIFQRQNLATAQTILALEELGFHSLADPPLDRDCVQGTGAGPYGGNRELIIFYSKTNEPYVNTDVLEVERQDQDKRSYRGKTYETKKIGGYLRFPAVDEKDPERVDFPTQKPVALIELLIQASCPESGRVLDCFVGSGTTCVAAMRLQRRSIGIDKEAAHVALTRQRCEETEVGVIQ